jgi:hypothetical protein
LIGVTQRFNDIRTIKLTPSLHCTVKATLALGSKRNLNCAQLSGPHWLIGNISVILDVTFKEEQMRRSAVGVTLTLLVIALSGCNSNSELKSNAISTDKKAVPPATAPEAFSSPAVATAPAPTVALTRPTDPNERIRVIKSGRADPFKPLVSPAQPSSQPNAGVSTSRRGTSGSLDKPTSRLGTAGRSTANRGIRSVGIPKPLQGSTGKANKPAAAGTGKAVLPPLPPPEPTVAKGVKVQGIVAIAGKRQAIVQAPEEKTARTISVGDRVSGGQVELVGFDMSNSIAPKAIFRENGMEVAIGVGQDPIVLASASLSRPAVRGLYKVTPQQ